MTRAMISGRRTLFKLNQFQDNICGLQFDLAKVHDTHLKENQSWGPRQYWQCKIHLHRNDLEVDRSAEGNYSTDLYGAKAAQIIRWKILIMWLSPNNDNQGSQPRAASFPLPPLPGCAWTTPSPTKVSLNSTLATQLVNLCHSSTSQQNAFILACPSQNPLPIPGMKRCMQTCQIVTGKLTWEWWLLWTTPLERSLLLSRRPTCEQLF